MVSRKTVVIPVHKQWSYCCLTLGHCDDNIGFIGFIQDCGNSSTNVVGLLQSCTEPSVLSFQSTILIQLGPGKTQFFMM